MRKSYRFPIVSIALSTSVLLMLSSCKEKVPEDGLHEQFGNIQYYLNGEIVTGLAEIDGETYYFEPEHGYMQQGWIDFSGQRYYFDESGKQVKGKQTIDQVEYIFDDISGALFTGWKETDDNKFYYFESDSDSHKAGQMAYGIQEIDGVTYYFINKDNQQRTPGSLLKSNRIILSNSLYCFDDEGKCYRYIDGGKPLVALTYDDGPSPYTKSILDTIEENKVRVTFFVVGNRVNDYKKTLAREYNLGCQIASHTYEHKYLTDLNEEGIKYQIDKADKDISDIINVKTKIMRPPGGKVDDKVKEYVNKPMILWSLDTEDWKSRDSSSVQSKILNNVKDGDIVLMHDLYESTADATKVIIPKLKDKGFQMVTVEELALLRGHNLEAGEVYRQFYPKKHNNQ